MDPKNFQKLGVDNLTYLENKYNKNTLAINSQGLAISFREDRKLQYIFAKSVKDVPDEKSQHLSLSDEDYNQYLKCNFQNLAFNKEGLILLLWSSTHVGAIELNIQYKDGGYTLGKSVFKILYHSPDNRIICESSFSPICSTHIVTLLNKENLIITDVNTHESRTIHMSLEHEFVSYTYGPSIDWMACTLFLLEKNGNIYYLCPILTSDSILLSSSEYIDNLYMWIEEFQTSYQNTVEKNKIIPYVNEVKAYLMQLSQSSFHDDKNYTSRNTVKDQVNHRIYKNPEDDNTESESEDEDDDDDLDIIIPGMKSPSNKIKSPPNKLTPVAQFDNDRILNSNVEDNRLVTYQDIVTQSNMTCTTQKKSTLTTMKIPKLQGPLITTTTTTTTSPFSMSNKKRSAVDICIPQYTSLDQVTPVILIAYDNGDIDSYFIGNTSSSSSFVENELDFSPSIGPLWLLVDDMLHVHIDTIVIDGDGDSDRYNQHSQIMLPIPTLELIDCVHINETIKLDICTYTSHSTGSSWQLYPDPVYSYYIHVWNPTLCCAYVIHMIWLQTLQKQQNLLLNESIEENQTDLDNYETSTWQKRQSYRQGDEDEINSIDDHLHLHHRVGDRFDHQNDDNDDNDASIDIEEEEDDEVEEVEDERYGIVRRTCTRNQSYKIKSTTSQQLTRISHQRKKERKHTSKKDSMKIFESDDTMIYEPSKIIPTFCPNLSLSKNNQTILCGISIHYDTFFGHLGIYQTNSGLIGCINLSSHIQYYESQLDFQAQIMTTRSDKNKSSTSSTTSDYSFYQKQQLLYETDLNTHFQHIIHNMGKVPLTSDMNTMKIETLTDITHPSIQALYTVKEYYDKQVVVPLYELKQKLKFRYDYLRHVYLIQKELLYGNNSGNTGLGSGENEDNQDKGIKNQLQYIQDKYTIYHQQYEIMNEKFLEQKQRIIQMLETITYLKSKISPTEQKYFDCLKKWSESAVLLETKLNEVVSQQQKLQSIYESTSQGGVLGSTVSPSKVTSPLADMYKTPSKLQTEGTRDHVSAESRTPAVAKGSMMSPYGSSTAVGTRTPYISLLKRQQQQQQKGLNIHQSSLTTVKAPIQDRQESEIKDSGSGGGMEKLSDDDIHHCMKLQTNQTEMLRASVVEIQEIEYTIKTLKNMLHITTTTSVTN